MKTLLLDRTVWDLVLDAAGNIALASDPYSRAQDVASAARTFLAECWYDTTKGIPYFENVLGQLPPIELLREHLVRAAMTVPGVVSARCIITSVVDRTVVGQIQFIDVDGESRNVAF